MVRSRFGSRLEGEGVEDMFTTIGGPERGERLEGQQIEFSNCGHLKNRLFSTPGFCRVWEGRVATPSRAQSRRISTGEGVLGLTFETAFAISNSYFWGSFLALEKRGPRLKSADWRPQCWPLLDITHRRNSVGRLLFQMSWKVSFTDCNPQRFPRF